ncbi:obscurin-like isoform X1 [Solea senegalensis]|uniref:Obscurin-like protein 1 n=1 Tax=Solea senegalensis TaxID=28829 RepID=A0AAV6RE00_SOLSE|nr:obscurin-like isoform X1 [Solea senegalensis]
MDVFGGAPRFLAYPRPVVVQSGTDAVLKCQISGDPRPAVIWERNNEKIDPQGQYRVFEDGNVYNLIISAVTVEDSGQYICKAKNSIGETYAAATLNVEGEAQEMEVREENKPRFLIKPLSTRVGRGEDAVFSCKLWGKPRPEVVWEKDGKRLNDIFESTHFTVGYQDGGWFQLKIFKTRAPDGGVYTCKARNEFGEALAGAVLLVDAGPGHEEEGNRNGYTNGHWKAHQGKLRSGRQVQNRLKDNSMTKSTKVKMFAVTEGKHAKFRCFVTGKPKPEIIWRKDGRLILSGRRYLLYEDREGYFTLKVLYCKQKDNGVYVCAASNTAGQTLSAVHLSVKEPPVRFKQPLIDLEVWERDLAILECEVPEDSVPITWYLEDRRLQPGAKYGMEEWGTKRRLTIRDIGVDDDGIYLCEMPDGGRSIAEVAVKGTILRKLPRKVDVLEGENAAFCVEVEKEEMDVHWYKEGIELRETHQTIIKSFGRTHILVFVNTMPQDAGLVTFLVGRSKTSSQLRVKAARHCPPSCPVAVQINTERANAALLSWVSAQDSRKNPPSGYVLERQEVGTGSQEWLQCLTTDSATSVEILGDSVPCEADYRFRICSVNKYGKSNNVEFPRAVHLVPVARIQAPLQDALVPEGEDAIFSIELSASVIGTWFLNGTQLQEDERFSMRRSRTHQSLRIRGVRDTDNGAEITFIAYGIRDSAALYIQAPLVKFSPMSEMDRNKFVEIGNPIVLYCELSDPATPVHWYKNGVELQTVEGLHIQSEGTMRRIVIQSAELSHSGVYCCDAIDDVIRFNVEVEAPPVRFSAIPDTERNITIYTGCPIVLQCQLSDPSAQVHWYKDGSKLHPESEVDILTNGNERKLIVHSAEFYHSGLYCCKTNGDTIVFSVDIKAPPVKFSAIPDEMRTKTIEAGCPIVLQCVVSDPEAHVCWYKEEMQLISNTAVEIHSEGNTRTLVVQSAELCHSGVYRCTTQDDTMEFQVAIKAPTLPLSPSPSPDVVEMQSLEATCPTAATCESSDPVVQKSLQGDKEHDSNRESDFQMGGIKTTLVIEPTHPSNSGAYYCATADDVAPLIEKNQVPPLTNQLGPDVETTNSAEEYCKSTAIVQQFEISDPIAKACWYKDGTQIYPKKELDSESQSSSQVLTLQSHDLSESERSADTQANVEMKAEQCHYGDENGEIAEASAQYTVDVKATSPRLSSGQEKSTEEANPAEDIFMSSKYNSNIFGSKRGDIQIYEDHSRHMPASQSTYEYTTDCFKTEQLKEFSEHQTINRQSPVYCSSAKPTIIQSDTHHNTPQSTELQGEELISYAQHAEELPMSWQTDFQSDEFCSGLQTASTESEKLHSSVQMSTIHSEQGSLQSEYVSDQFQISGIKSDKLFNTFTSPHTAVIQTEEPSTPVHIEKHFTSSHTATVHSEEPYTSSYDAAFQSKEPNTSSHTTAIQSEELYTASHTADVQSEEPYTSSHITAVHSEEPYTSSYDAAFQSKEPNTSSHTTAIQSEELYTASHTADVQSEELYTSSHTASVQSEELFEFLNAAAIQSEEPLSSSHTAAVQSDELCFTTSNIKVTKTEKLCNSAEVPAVMSEKLLDCLQMETVSLESPSLWTATNQSEELNMPLQTLTDWSEKVSVFPKDISPQSGHMCNSKKVDPIQTKDHYKLQQLAHVRQSDLPGHLEEMYPSMQDSTVQTACHHSMEATEDCTVNSGQRSSKFAEPYQTKQVSAVQPEESYLSRTCDSHWIDSFTANKVAVGGDLNALPVTITTLGDAERSKSVEAGEPLVLRCEVSDPNAQVTWYKDGIKLHEAAGQELVAEGSIRTLAVQSAMPSHAGIYSCETTDDAMQFHVDVKAPLVKFSAMSEADQVETVTVDYPVALQCEPSEPTGQVEWDMDGTTLLPQSGIDFQSEGIVRSLVVPSAELTHTDVHCCESNNDDTEFAVKVEALPVKFSELQETDKNKSIQEGATIVLSCELALDPSAHVDWYKDGMELLPQDNVEIQSDGLTRTLLIHSAESKHGGTYECSTSDDTVTFKVDVQGRSPQIMPIPSSEQCKRIAFGFPIMLQCVVSEPVAQVSWFKDGVELFCKTGLDMKRDGSFRKLIIHSAKVSDSGLYSCSLANDVVTFHVDVEAPPVRFSALPEIATHTFVEAGCPIKQLCEASEPTAQVDWHKDEEKPLPKSRYEIEISENLRELAVESAEVRHSGVRNCEATDDHIEFKVDVTAVPEAGGNKCVEAGSLTKLQISDPTNNTCSYEDGVKLLPKLGINIDSESSERTLVMKSPTSSYAEVYSCKIDDESDSDSNSFVAEVKAPPVTFVDIPEEELFKSVVEKEQLVLSCEVSRDDAIVQWYKDGAEMQPSIKVTMEAESTRRNLTIHSAQLSDAGTYTCRVGDHVLLFKVTIREPPVMIIYPKEDVHLDRHVPDEIILSCELSRISGVVSWYKDGQKLQDSENIKLKIEGPYRRLKILSSGVEDSGEYVCDTADDSIFFHLSITEPPVRIVSPSQSQMELCQQTSERMVLSCEISRPNAVVRWYRDGLEVEENDNLILEVDGVYRRLIIPETTVKDSAEYVCDTADDSVTFFVNIAEPPVRFIRPRKMASRVEKVAGETLVLDCEVSRSNAEVTWKKNGEEVEDSRNITILEDGAMHQLTIHSLTVKDAGQYVCDAKDDVMDFQVKVKELPVKILGKPEAKTEKEFLVTDDIILVCELSRSNVSVTWYKDNELIDDTERYCIEEQGVFRSLVVLNAGLQDSGEYACDAVDDKMVFHITVKEPPVQIIGNSGHPEHHILAAGDDLILECEVSRSDATVQWLWNGEILKPDPRIKIDSYDVVRKLVVSGLQPSDSGKYICDATDDQMITIVEVQEPPAKFVNKQANNNILAYENESVTLCAIVNNERANVRWLKDGQLLNEDNIHISSEGNTHKLTINPLQLSNSGEYVCDVNTDEMYFSLLVKEMKVKFIRPLENTVCIKGRSLTLRCEINKPKGDVQWLKDGQEISPNRRHTIRAQGRERSFTIHQIVEEDAGEYVCESTDDRTSSTVIVETPRVVEFIAEVRNITVREGEDAVFKCVVSPEDTQLVWRLNGKQIAQNERTVISSNGLCHMLCIHNCLVSDSGKVTADAEGLVSEAELHVQEQQVLFTKTMVPVVAEEYSEAVLEVEVSLESEEIQWMRQGVLIHPGAKYTLKHKGRKHSLTIHKVAMSDRGTYSCETLHDRTQAQLTVEPRKVTLKRGLVDITTTERETASFEVELSHPNVPGTWMRNGIKLKPTSHFRISAKGQVHSLIIYNLSVEDTGTFTFSVENLKTSARLVVKEPPVTIFRKLEDQKFSEAAVISLECELSRHNVDVKWFKNGVEMKPSKEVRIYAMGRKRFLQIIKCHVSDSGTYTCDAGEATTFCTVEVYERELLILQGLEDLDIQEDENAVFVCEITVDDVPGEWFKNGERIQPTSTVKIRQEGTKHFLLMCNVRPEDSGEIKFVARHVESIAYLEVEEVPINIVKPLQDKTVLEKTRVILDCTVSNSRCSIRWYKGPNVILPSERFEISSEGCYRKLIIQHVLLDDDGTYSVQVGECTCSAKLTVEAQSLLMVRELKDVEVAAPNEASFECEVSAPVVKAPVWSLNGEALQPSSRVRLEKMGTVHRLTLRQTSTDMSGVVEFTSGKAKSSAQLRVLSDA